jgi:sugar transferase (PEP-CTERM/EpsH1 system associated)
MANSIKIMHILHTLGTAGLQKGVVNITNQLNSNGFEISICCLEESGEFEKRLNPGTKIFVMNKLPGIDYILPLKLANLFRREKIMIVHTHDLGTYLYGAVGAKLALLPKVIHGEHGAVLQPSGSRPKDLVAYRYLSYITKVIHTTSDDLKRQLVRMTQIDDRKVIAILNGVEIDKFKKESNTNIRKTLAIETDDFVIGTVSRLAPVKNFELLIRVIPEINRTGLYPKVLFVGDGPSRPNLESLTRQYGLEKQIIFLGDRSDVPDLLNAMDVFVLTSFSEGLSNSIMEAMASGLPIVATDVGGNSELVINNETGFLFPSQDAGALAQRILQLADDVDNRNKIGLAGRKRMEDFFTMDKMIQNYENLYRSAIRK